MSGPVSTEDVPPAAHAAAPTACEMEVSEGRRAEVGGFGVRRVLPRRERRTVGAWCFADQMGPGLVTADRGLDIGPHPHMGLQTVTWLLAGAVLHRDSLGSEQVIRPGQLNLMTAGHGVSHSEETTGTHTGPVHGVQLWVAQPETTRHDAPAFEHHAELPVVELDRVAATVLIGHLGDARSPARRDTDHLGVDLALRSGEAALPLDPRFEHALVVLEGDVSVGGRELAPGQLGYLGIERDELRIEARASARVLLIGGAPFPEPPLMWWNYVARTKDEITDAHREWTARGDRFGSVASPLPPIDAPGPPWAS